MLALVRNPLTTAVARQQLAQLPCTLQACYATGAGKVVELQSDTEYQAALKDLADTQGKAIIDFTAKWCGPCKVIAPVYESLATEFPSLRLFKVDIDNQDVAQAVMENSVAAVPTFVGYRGSERVAVFSGADKGLLRRLAAELSGSGVK